MEVTLPITLRIKLRLRHLICAWRQRYERHLKALRKVSSALPEHVDEFCIVHMGVVCAYQMSKGELKGQQSSGFSDLGTFDVAMDRKARSSGYATIQ